MIINVFNGRIKENGTKDRWHEEQGKPLEKTLPSRNSPAQSQSESSLWEVWSSKRVEMEFRTHQLVPSDNDIPFRQFPEMHFPMTVTLLPLSRKLFTHPGYFSYPFSSESHSTSSGKLI